jgi:PEP-CTERM motif
MNPMNQLLKKHGLKVALPLLLLTTACGGEGTSSTLQSDNETPTTEQLQMAKAITDGFGTPSASGGGLPAPSVTQPPTSGNGGSGSPAVLPPSNGGPVPTTNGATKVPEPTALMGLAIAAAGMVVIKRKQAA